MSHKETYFKHVDDLVKHLFYLHGELTPIKLQKTLYFLYAIYAGMYSKDTTQIKSEEDFQLPDELFPARFEAWTYGPVMPAVYVQQKYSGGYSAEAFEFSNDNIGQKVKEFVEDVSNQTVSKSDFSLVDRSHEDKAWQEAVNQPNDTMDNEFIRREYREMMRIH